MHSNLVYNRILVRHIGTAISYLFIYLFSGQICNQHFRNPQLRNIKYIKSKERFFKGILK